MHIRHLSLTNFRNYGRLELDLPLGPILLHGDNAQGKTNLLEAIYYLATTRSPHADQDAQLINWIAAQSEEPIVVCRLVADVAAAAEKRQIEMRLIQEVNLSGRNGGRTFRREALVNRRKVRLMDLLGKLQVVQFLPEDMQLVTGPPGNRRRYMDITLCQIDPIYCRQLSQYNKILEQRNALLRRLAEGRGKRDVLPIFTEKLIKLGSEIFRRRAMFLANLARETHRIHYEELTEGKETVRLGYLPRLQENGGRRADELIALEQLGEWLQSHVDDADAVQARFEQALAAALPTDMVRCTTSVGPHRDDWRFWINGRNLASYGSRGQQRSAILALKLAEIHWMTKISNETPVLLLDEVVAELDEHRRALLLTYIKELHQALLTATDPGMFTKDFLRQATTMAVENGRVIPDKI
ncbi:MAG: DNA replication/repair protein RecF [Chloroflexi bacterium]|nr:MAG: DNA replication/repair protein RecF [Chloroflexota bacterium]